uniref:Fork-head domain-containing protein n=1 Tax=Heterorhabditis bacteriophora TaxID=37862 RepID=A0A1I7WJ55_HETBA
MVSVHSPFDAYSFIPSEGDNLFMPSIEDMSRKGPDSGLGSEASPISYNHASPDRSTLPLDVDTFELFAKKKEKEDDEDSGFRSRVNSGNERIKGFSCAQHLQNEIILVNTAHISGAINISNEYQIILVTQSCSPGSSSAFSSDGGSPKRKMSGSEGGESAASNYSLGGYGTGPTYGQQLFHPFDQAVGGDDGSLNFAVPEDEIMKFLVTSFSTMLRPDVPLSGGIAVAMRANYPIHKICKDLYVEQSRSPNFINNDFMSFDPLEWKESHNVDYAFPYEKSQEKQISLSSSSSLS